MLPYAHDTVFTTTVIVCFIKCIPFGCSELATISQLVLDTEAYHGICVVMYAV
jgi:hypothetical protein